MSYTSRDRDRGRLAVAAVTGIGTVGALTATGWLAGAAASDFAAQQAASAGTAPVTGAQDGTGRSRDGRRGGVRKPGDLRQRPYVTRVTLRYVDAAGGAVVPGPDSTVPRDSSGRSGSSGSSGSSGPGSASDQAPPAEATPAEAPPAPSSGS